jgi:hypothetical protein
MTSRFYDTAELAIELRLVTKTGAPDIKRAHAYAQRYLPKTAIKWRGRRMLIERAAVDAALEARS